MRVDQILASLNASSNPPPPASSSSSSHSLGADDTAKTSSTSRVLRERPDDLPHAKRVRSSTGNENQPSLAPPSDGHRDSSVSSTRVSAAAAADDTRSGSYRAAATAATTAATTTTAFGSHQPHHASPPIGSGVASDPIVIDDTSNDDGSASAPLQRTAMTTATSVSTTTQEILVRHAAFLARTRRENARLAEHSDTLLFVDSSVMYEQAVEYVREKHSSFFETLVPVARHRIGADMRYQVRTTDGDTILANIEADFDNFPMKRSYLQRMFHRLMLNVMAPLIYSEEWRDNRLAIMDRNQWQDYPPIMAAVCPRRFGKTVGVAQGASVALLEIPNIKIGCFAPTLRQAEQLMAAIFQILVQHPSFSKFRIVKRKAQCIVIYGEGSERSITAYPSTHKVEA